MGAELLPRVLGASLLKAKVYEEVEADRGAIGQAIGVVLLSSAAAGLGARGLGAEGLFAVPFFAGVALAAWVVWAALIYHLGAFILPARETRADMGQLLRTIGFASSPGLIRILGIIPPLALPAFALSAVWMLAAMIVAVRQALDYPSTTRAVAVCVLGWLLAGAFAIVLGMIFGPGVS